MRMERGHHLVYAALYCVRIMEKHLKNVSDPVLVTSQHLSRHLYLGNFLLEDIYTTYPYTRWLVVIINAHVLRVTRCDAFVLAIR